MKSRSPILSCGPVCQLFEDCLDLSWKRHLRLKSCAVRAGTAEFELPQQTAWSLDPAGLAVEGPGAVAALRMLLKEDLRGLLIGSLRPHRELAFATQAFVPETLTVGDKAGEGIQLLGSAQRRDVLVQNLSSRRLHRIGFDDIVPLGIGIAVQRIQRDCGRRYVTGMVAGVAGHHLRACEILLIDVRDHLHHLARRLLLRCVEHPIYFVATRAGVAIGAIQTQRIRHDAHGPQEIVRG